VPDHKQARCNGQLAVFALAYGMGPAAPKMSRSKIYEIFWSKICDKLPLVKGG